MNEFLTQDTGKFHVDDNGVCHAETNKNKEEWWRPICSRLDVVAQTRNETDTGWGKLLDWKDPDGGLHTWAMPMKMLDQVGEGDPTSVLRDGGLRIEPGSKKLVMEYIAAQDPARRVRCTHRTGWYGHSFVLPGRVTIRLESAEEKFTRPLPGPGMHIR